MTAGNDVTRNDHPGPMSRVRSDMVGAIIAAVIFAGALWATAGWPYGAALFPRIIAAGGLFFSVLYLLVLIGKSARARSAAARAVARDKAPLAAESDATDADDPLAHDMPEPEDAEYVFASVGLVRWLAALGWVALFLVLLTFLGLFAASAVFAIGYLRWGAGRSWLFATVYAVVLPVFLILLFRVLLYVPTPLGILTGL